MPPIPPISGIAGAAPALDSGSGLSHIAASVVIGKPVKWSEDRSENLQADSFARDYYMSVELAANNSGKMEALRIKTVADYGYTDAAANPSKYPAGMFSICTGSYDIKTAFTEMDAYYTNKPPGGVAYRCSFRDTEAVHAIERIVDVLAQKLGRDPAELRMQNFETFLIPLMSINKVVFSLTNGVISQFKQKPLSATNVNIHR